MKNLDDILRDPRAHRAEVSCDQVNAWGEEVLDRWNAEQLKSAVQESRSFRAILTAVLFWGSLTAGVVMLGSLLWDRLGISMDRLREIPNSLGIEMAGHPLWLGAIVLCLGVWFTRPLREMLLD
ncbi:MAG: hypothetical protein O3A95_05490 [Planctomycetota bacterium]|nr:hypothetical protein [Planctomycetota bacterium]MDA1113739.1 hypothetical protein [Planctomycetota bacterium]